MLLLHHHHHLLVVLISSLSPSALSSAISYVCPLGEVPYLDVVTGEPQSCESDGHCPLGYVCATNGVCCGAAGLCPVAQTPSKDRNGRLTACVVREAHVCGPGSLCLPSSRTSSQRLCCEPPTRFCPSGWQSSPLPDAAPMPCRAKEKDDCPEGSLCILHSFSQGVCCTQAVRHLRLREKHDDGCPSGWRAVGPSNGCSPSAASSESDDIEECPGSASCLLSTSGSGFRCCLPLSSPPPFFTEHRRHLRRQQILDGCPVGTSPELIPGSTAVPRSCSIYSPICSSGYICSESSSNSGAMVCCSQPVSAVFLCPAPGQRPLIDSNGRNVLCQNGPQRLGCPSGAVCVPASNAQGLNICCRLASSINVRAIAASPNPCPGGTAPQISAGAGGGDITCQPNEAASVQCTSGFTCLRSVTSASVSVCCSMAPYCSNNQQLQTDSTGRPLYCSGQGGSSPTSTCPSGSTCQPAQNSAAGTYVCCGAPSTPGGGPSPSNSCPSGYTPSLTPSGSAISCSPVVATGCPSGASCVPSTTLSSLYICCRANAAPSVCPNGLNASLTASGGLETCGGPGGVCSRSGYTCTLSTSANTWVCCGAQVPLPECADGSDMYSPVAGEVYECDAQDQSPPCPSDYLCEPSTQRGISVCCTGVPGGGAQLPTQVPPIPSNVFGCPLGWSAYNSLTDGSNRFCRAPLDTSCPTGYSCTQSTQVGTFMCCRLASVLQCPNSATLLLNGEPRLCWPARPTSCPPGYVCTTSNFPTVSICCQGSGSSHGRFHNTLVDEPLWRRSEEEDQKTKEDS